MLIAYLVCLLILGVNGGLLGYALYYRSDTYRRSVEADLTDFFGLPIEIAWIEPHSFSARKLMHVQAWLPDRRAKIFECREAIWDSSGTESGVGTRLTVRDSSLTVGSAEWQQGDYMRVLRASLQHDFSALNVQEVALQNAKIHWPQRGFDLRAEGVNGLLALAEDGTGLIDLTTRRINAVEVTEPIQIHARIDPSREDAFIPEVILDTPRLSLASLELGALLASEISQGWFEGRIELSQYPGGQAIRVLGEAGDLQLAEWTAGFGGSTVPGIVDVKINEAIIRQNNLESLSFEGSLRDLQPDPLMLTMGGPPIGGKLFLRIYGGRWSRSGIDELRLNGHWQNGSVKEALSALLGPVETEGDLDVRINAIVIEDNELVSGNVDLVATPRSGRRGYITKDLLVRVLRDQLGLNFPTAFLPARIEYLHAGAKLLVDHEQLRLLSLKGPRGEALITLRLLDRPFALLEGIDERFDLRPLLDLQRARLQACLLQLQEKLERVRPAAEAP
jgi:hypothetical protein